MGDGRCQLDPRLAQCLNAFEPASFDVGQVASVLSTERSQARKIPELVAVHDADQQWDFAEDARAFGGRGTRLAGVSTETAGSKRHIESAGFVVLPPFRRSSPRERNDRRAVRRGGFGATGFTGGLVTRYLARKKQAGQLPDELRLRLQVVTQQARRLAESVEVPVGQIVANTTDQASVDSWRGRHGGSTTVGLCPAGQPLVKACLSGADYLDITGEPTFATGFETATMLRRETRRAGDQLLRLR